MDWQLPDIGIGRYSHSVDRR